MQYLKVHGNFYLGLYIYVNVVQLHLNLRSFQNERGRYRPQKNVVRIGVYPPQRPPFELVLPSFSALITSLHTMKLQAERVARPSAVEDLRGRRFHTLAVLSAKGRGFSPKMEVHQDDFSKSLAGTR